MGDEHDLKADALAFNMMLSIVNEWHRQVGIDEVMKTKLTRAIADTVATRCVREALAAALREAVAADRKRYKEFQEFISFIDGDGVRAKAIVAVEDAEVAALCECIGYGAVMDSAARQWFLKDPDGALTVGPTASHVRCIAAAIEETGPGNPGPAVAS